MRGQDPFHDAFDAPETFPNSIRFRDISLKVFDACAPEFKGAGADSDD